MSVITNFCQGKVYWNNQILLDDPKSAVILLSLHKAAKEVTRYSFIGGEAYMLSELIPDEMPHYTSRDDRSMRVLFMSYHQHLLTGILGLIAIVILFPCDEYHFSKSMQSNKRKSYLRWFLKLDFWNIRDMRIRACDIRPRLLVI